MKKLVSFFIGILLTAFLSSQVVAKSTEAERMIVGTHPLTLQWLPDGTPAGVAFIHKKDGKIWIDGAQEEDGAAGDYFTINGEIRIINAREFEFVGKAVSSIKHVNGGKPYERSGKFLFKAWGKRKYWRMQNMTQPDGPHTLTDYIDIFFEKLD
ncbi:MAG: hypothetical protein Q4G70_02205 [Pseudomonadota bacterium]|nr:hypothetical protein [Pseudomonadota bacterium]